MADPGHALNQALARVGSEAPQYVKVLQETGDSLENTSSGLLATLFAAVAEEEELSQTVQEFLRQVGRRRAAQGIDLELALQILDIHRSVVLETIERQAPFLADAHDVVIQAQRRVFLMAERLIASWAEGYADRVEAHHEADQQRQGRLFTIARAIHQSLEARQIGRAGLEATLDALGLEVGGVWDQPPEATLSLLAGRGLDETGGRIGAEGILSEALAKSEPAVVDVRLRLSEGTAKVSAVAISFRAEGKVLGALLVGSRRRRSFDRADLDFLAEIAHQMAVALAHAREARTDHLTGLGNRAEFERSLDREMALAKRHNRSLSLLLIDLDSLKSINDRFGHAAGDVALRAVGEAIRGVVRASDLSARLGGDEFAVAIPEAGPGLAWEVGTRLRTSLSEIGRRHGLPATLDVSLGVAEWRPGMPWEELFRAADKTLYVEKRKHHRKRVTA
jgi:diguanylate cyclase (GGDEF)-like protein